ncbi:hypothetical protein FGB62_5g421 [Gracilaria domingensis]|nr:hypothetical protein FGB62_5g421 [Gracilaria domingensis]
MMTCFSGKGEYDHETTHIKPIQIQRTIPVGSYEIPAWFEVQDADSLIYQQSEILSLQLDQMHLLSQEREQMSFQIDKETSLSASKKKSFNVLKKRSSKKIKKMRTELNHVTDALKKLLSDKQDTEERIDLLRLFRAKAKTHEFVEKMGQENGVPRAHAEDMSKNARLIKLEIEECRSSISKKEEQLLESEEVLKKYEQEDRQVSTVPSDRSTVPSDRSEDVQKLVRLLKIRIESLFECIHELEKLSLLNYFPFRDPRNTGCETQTPESNEKLSCYDDYGSSLAERRHIPCERNSEQSVKDVVKLIRTRDDAIRKLQSIARELVKDLKGLRTSQTTGSRFVHQLQEKSQCRKICLVYSLCQELTDQCDYVAYRGCVPQELLPSVDRQRRLATLSAELVQQNVDGISSPTTD